MEQQLYLNNWKKRWILHLNWTYLVTPSSMYEHHVPYPADTNPADTKDIMNRTDEQNKAGSSRFTSGGMLK